MTTIVGLSGSLRAGSFNSALLRAAANALPAGTALEIASIKEIPLYDGDVEAAHGLPEAVTRLKERIVAADGLLLVTPEYNNSIPGVFKNAIDWLSRPPPDIARVFGGRPVGVIGASPGRFGTLLSQAAWLPVLKTLGTAAYSAAACKCRMPATYSMTQASSSTSASASCCASISRASAPSSRRRAAQSSRARLNGDAHDRTVRRRPA
jgi:NAD(P)H-dependent FMN reductase